MASSNRRKRHDFVMQVLDQHEQPLTRYAARVLGGDVASARDVVQHAFMKLCQQDIDELRDRVAPWLYRVCRNRAIDLMRGRNQQQPLDQEAERLLESNGRSDPFSVVAEADFVAKLKTLLDDLPAGQREIVELWCNGLSSQQVGEIVGKTAGAVRISLHRAIKSLREHSSVQRWLSEEVA